MDSLRHNERSRNPTEKELAVAKSRKKEKSKASKPVEDISAFFNQFRKPLHEINLNNRQQTILPTAETEAIIGGDANTTSKPKYASSERVSLPRKQASVSVLEVPQQPSSYMSWSERRYSRKQSMEHTRSRRMYRRASTTPESVKRSLEATGIYVDTGIEDDHPYARSFTEDLPQIERHHRRELLEHSQNMSTVSEISFEDHASRNPALSSVSARRRYADRGPRDSRLELKEREVQQTNRSHYPYEDGEPPQSDRRGTTRHHQSVEQVRSSDVEQLELTNRPKSQSSKDGVIVEHFNKDMGWHQEVSSLSHINTSTRPFSASRIPQPVETSRPSREELAKRTKIKRPATTLPVIQPSRLEDRNLATKQSASAEKAQDSEAHTSTTNASQLPHPSGQPHGPTIQQEQNKAGNMSSSKESSSSHHTTLSERVARIEQGLAQQRIPAPMADAQVPQTPGFISPPFQPPQVYLTTKLGLPVRGGLNHDIPPRPRSSLLHNSDSFFWRQAHPEEDYLSHNPLQPVSRFNDNNGYPSLLATDRPYFDNRQLDSMDFQPDDYMLQDTGDDHMHSHEYENTMLENDDLASEHEMRSWQDGDEYENYPVAEHMADEQQIDDGWYGYNEPDNQQPFFGPEAYNPAEADYGLYLQPDIEGGIYSAEQPQQPFLDINREYWYID
jgi:hypothetical protein